MMVSTELMELCLLETYLNLAMSRLTRRMLEMRRKTNIQKGATHDPYTQPSGCRIESVQAERKSEIMK